MEKNQKVDEDNIKLIKDAIETDFTRHWHEVRQQVQKILTDSTPEKAQEALNAAKNNTTPELAKAVVMRQLVEGMLKNGLSPLQARDTLMQMSATQAEAEAVVMTVDAATGGRNAKKTACRHCKRGIL